MQLLAMIVLSLLIFVASTTSSVQQSIDQPVAVATARAQVDKYRVFMFVANLYMQNYTGGAATIGWTTLRTAPGAPSGAANSMMPSSWKVVAAADNTWVACTDLDERAVSAVQQLAVNGGLGLQQVSVNGTSMMVAGTAADSGKANLCG